MQTIGIAQDILNLVDELCVERNGQFCMFDLNQAQVGFDTKEELYEYIQLQSLGEMLDIINSVVHKDESLLDILAKSSKKSTGKFKLAESLTLH